MSEIILSRDVRLTLRSQAHHLDPVVLLGAGGLTEAVMKEIDRELKAHELIKVRVPTDDREEREAIFAKVADELGAARVQMIGKLLILWRPADEDEPSPEEWIARAASAARGLEKEAQRPAKPAKKIASKKPGEKKQKAAPQPRRRRRPKTKRTTKKAALS